MGHSLFQVMNLRMVMQECVASGTLGRCLMGTGCHQCVCKNFGCGRDDMCEMLLVDGFVENVVGKKFGDYYMNIRYRPYKSLFYFYIYGI
ncbi:hypothetical protein CEXT_793891 [Caerostris extrusa]|uniref:Uncharacterized protein n=1 Tax=Caerostris extrusa TaxID=172846 RepID=A0AAV4QVN7_CAEEX|nr:hypothetical protein CEXT_793891 [Caerostris extrusa]